MVNNKVVFNFKSNWFDTNVVNKIGVDGLWIYFNIRKYKLQYSKSTCIFSLDLLHKELQHYYKDKEDKGNNRKFNKKYIKEVIFNLKKYKILDFDRKYNMVNSTDLCCCELLDLPNLDVNFKPIGTDDYFITFDTDTVTKIFEVGLNERHIISYYCLKKYINVQGTASGHITLSYKKMGEWIGVDKDTVNRWCVELEDKKIIGNEYTKSQSGHKCNSFVLTTNKNIGDDATVNEISDKNRAKRLKKRLQNKKIKVTSKAFDGLEEIMKSMTKDETIKFNQLKEKNIVFAIEYIYFELLEGLKQRKKNNDGFVKDIMKQNNITTIIEETTPADIDEGEPELTYDEILEIIEREEIVDEDIPYDNREVIFPEEEQEDEAIDEYRNEDRNDYELLTKDESWMFTNANKEDSSIPYSENEFQINEVETILKEQEIKDKIAEINAYTVRNYSQLSLSDKKIYGNRFTIPWLELDIKQMNDKFEEIQKYFNSFKLKKTPQQKADALFG